MAGQWIRWEKGLTRKPEIAQIARATGLDACSVAARCMLIWEWADDNTITGIIDGATWEQVDAISGCNGFAHAMANTRPHPWILFDDQGVTFPNYAHHNGVAAKKRLHDAHRLREWRASRGIVKRVS
jgi:hypothetical protein